MKQKPISKAVRLAFRDVAFPFRMGAGFPGDVNRTHPASILPSLLDETDTFLRYGDMGVFDATDNTIRALRAADASDNTDLTPFGALVRPYPYQAPAGSSNAAQAIGDATPPTEGIGDFLEAGHIMVQLNTGVTDPVKGGRVFIWCAANSGNHKQGCYETELSTGNTVKLDARYRYNGPPDDNGVVELICNA